jgi:hypothetical protein
MRNSKLNLKHCLGISIHIVVVLFLKSLFPDVLNEMILVFEIQYITGAVKK